MKTLNKVVLIDLSIGFINVVLAENKEYSDGCKPRLSVSRQLSNSRIIWFYKRTLMNRISGPMKFPVKAPPSARWIQHPG